MIPSALFISLLIFGASFALANPAMTGKSTPCPPAYEVLAGGEAVRGSAASRRTSKYDDSVKAIRAEQLKWKEKGVEDAHLPFVRDHGHKTKRAIVLIHGISETPAGMKFLAEEYHKQGFNVITVLLEGHGTTPEALNNGNLAAWRDQIDHAVKQAAPLGDKVMIGGYSFGATLALDAGARLKDTIGGVALHSPMLVADAEVSDKVRARPTNKNVPEPLRKWTNDKADESKPGIEGHTYQRTPTDAYIRMLDDVVSIQPVWQQKIDVPIFVSYGEADRIADPKGTQQFIELQGLPPENVLYVEGAQHDDTVRVTKRRRYPTEGTSNLMSRMMAP